MPSLPFMSNYCVSLKQLCIPLKMYWGNRGKFYLTSVPDDLYVTHLRALWHSSSLRLSWGHWGGSHFSYSLMAREPSTKSGNSSRSSRGNPYS